MGDVLPAVAGAQRYGDALGADGGVAAASDGEDLVQRRCRARLDGDEPAAAARSTELSCSMA